MTFVIIWGVIILLIFILPELIPYIYKLTMMGKVRIYKFDDGFAVKQFGHSTYNNIRYNYDSSCRYEWYWITTEKQPTCNPIHLSQIEAEELAQSLHDDYMTYIQAEKAYIKATKTKEKNNNSAKLFKKL